MYKRKSYDLGDIREVMEYHNGRIWCSGNAKREKEESHTGADQEGESVEQRTKMLEKDETELSGE